MLLTFTDMAKTTDTVAVAVAPADTDLALADTVPATAPATVAPADTDLALADMTPVTDLASAAMDLENLLSVVPSTGEEILVLLRAKRRAVFDCAVHYTFE